MKTLAARLGTTTHVSALLYKARKLGLMTPTALANLAAQRGCRPTNYIQCLEGTEIKLSMGRGVKVC